MLHEDLHMLRELVMPLASPAQAVAVPLAITIIYEDARLGCFSLGAPEVLDVLDRLATKPQHLRRFGIKPKKLSVCLHQGSSLVSSWHTAPWSEAGYKALCESPGNLKITESSLTFLCGHMSTCVRHSC